MSKVKEFPILYKKANLLNKINQWQIVVEGDSYYTISGYTDGKQFQNEPTICTPKNKGKKNATTGKNKRYLRLVLCGKNARI